MSNNINSSAIDNHPLQFADDGEEHPHRQADAAAWKVMVVDDDKTVHNVTEMVLRGFTYKQRGLEIIHGYSGAEAQALIQQHPDTAVILLDVVMENDSAGLDTVRFIRDQLHNRTTRIILRTGLPGEAPEERVIRDYDINDYKEKGELTAQRLEMALITSLRSYDDIITIQQLSSANSTLESLVAARTRELTEANTTLRSQIEERIKAHAALQRSETRLAEAQRIARIGNFEWDLGTDTQLWSGQIYRILDLPRPEDEMEQPHASAELFAAMPEEERSAVKTSIQQAIDAQGRYEIKHRIQTRAGVVRHVRQMGELAVDAHSGARRISATLQDISERHQAEVEIRKLSARVLLRVAQDAIAYGLAIGRPMAVNLKKYENVLQEPQASFITLTLHGKLRGSAGATEASQPLVMDVARNAYAAAFTDPRFAPLTAAEFRDIEIGLTLLSPAEELHFGSEEALLTQLRPNIDGVILTNGQKQGVLLPDAWEQYPAPRDFFTQLKHQAGLDNSDNTATLTVKRFTAESFP